MPPDPQPQATDTTGQPSWMAPVMPVVPDHELIRRIGGGSYGDVWLARTMVGTWRAVKVVFRDRFTDARPYEREFNGIQKFEPLSRGNEAFIDILQIGRNDAEGYFYYVMELADDAGEAVEQRGKGEKEISGEHSPTSAQLSSAPFPLFSSATYIPKTLSKVLLQRGRLPVSECLELGLTLNLGLAHLHRAGLIHRDIKPSNIIFVGGVPKLADIGLVIELAEARSFVGTEGFIPPEGPNSPQADLYSLGKVLYEAGMGKDRKDFPEPYTQIAEAPDATALLEFNAILLKACAANREERYQSAEEMNADLALLQSGGSVRRQRKLAGQLRFVQRAGAVVTALAAVIALGWWWQARQTRVVRGLAEENLTLARRADDNATEAKKNELAARERLYAADINLAQQALQADNLRLARSLLQNHVPQPGQPDLRGFEWRYLWQQSRSEELFSIPGHTNNARVLAFSPDGQRIAVGGYFGTAMILDLSTRRRIAVLPGTNALQSIEFSSDGKWLATGSHLDVHLWDAQTFEEIRQLPEAVAPAVFTPDGKHLLTYRKPPSGKRVNPMEEDWRLDVWDTGHWSVADSLKLAVSGSYSGSRDLYVQPVFAPDGKRLVILSGDTIRLFSFPDLREVLVLPERIPLGIGSRPFIALSSDNRTLATVSPKGFGVRLWNLEENRELRLLAGHGDHIFSAAFSPDGKVLATGSADQTIKLWDVATGELLNSFPGQGDEVIAVAFSPDGKLLASLGIADAVVKLWDPNRRARRNYIRRPLWPVGFDVDGSLISFRSPGLVPVVIDPSDFELTRIDAPAAHRDVKHAFYLNSVSSDGSLQVLWGAGQDGNLDHMEVWDRRLAKHLCSLPALSPVVSFAPRSALIATRTTNQVGVFTTTIWQLPSGTAKWVFTNEFECIVFSPDEQHLLTPEGDKLRLWRIAGQELVPLQAFQATKDFTPRSAFSPDGRLLATSGRDITLWSLPSLEVVGVLKGHTRTTTILAFSPDSRTLASIADDRTVRIWHVSTQRELISFQTSEQDNGHFQVEFSPDGRALATRRVDTQGPITWLYYAPSFAEIAVAEGGDYQMLAGRDPATWLAVAKALMREQRWEEALKALTEVQQLTAGQENLDWLQSRTLSIRTEVLKRLDRVEDAGRAK